MVISYCTIQKWEAYRSSKTQQNEPENDLTWYYLLISNPDSSNGFIDAPNRRT